MPKSRRGAQQHPNAMKDNSIISEWMPKENMPKRDGIGRFVPSTQTLPANQLEPWGEAHQDTEEHYCFDFGSSTRVWKILKFGDVHVPWQLTSLMQRAILAHADADIIDLGGDLWDCFAVAFYYKDPMIMARMKQVVHNYFNINRAFAERFGWDTHPLLAELSVILQIIEYCCRYTSAAKIVMREGNHEFRLQRYFKKAEVKELLGIKTDHIGELVESALSLILAEKDMHRVRVVKHWHSGYGLPPKGEYGTDAFGLVECGHPFTYSPQPGRLATVMADYFIDRDLANHSRLLVLEHTHHSSRISRRGREVLEPGCFCKRPDYADSGRLGAKEQEQGYALIYLTPQEVDLENSRIIPINRQKVPI